MKERNAFFSNVGLCMKLALVTLLLIGGGNFAWAATSQEVTDDFSGYSSPGTGRTLGENWVIIGSNSNAHFGTITCAYVYTNSGDTHYIAANSGSNFNYGTWLVLKKKVTGTVSFTLTNDGSSANTAYVSKMLEVGDTYETIGSPIEKSVSKNSTNSYTFDVGEEPTNVAFCLVSYSSYLKLKSVTYNEYIESKELAAPTSLVASVTAPQSLTLNWTKGNDETKWQMSYSTSSGDHSTTTSDFTDKPHIISGLEPSTTYYVSIRAKKNNEYSDWSTESNFTTADPIEVTSVTISESSCEILPGGSKTLTADVLPVDATYKSLTWETSNSSVATVNSSGVVTAKSTGGSATITVRSIVYPTKYATCEVTVPSPVTPTAFKTSEVTKDYAYLTWTNGSSESTWQIKYGTTSGNLNKTSGDFTDKPYLIVGGLEANTTYYASIRSKLGSAYSGWSAVMSFVTPSAGDAPDGGTVASEDFENDWPLSGYYLNGVKSGWGYSNAYGQYRLNNSYNHSGKGLYNETGTSHSNYIVTPAVKAGTTITFWSCRGYSSGTGYVRLFKAIKVGGNYYVDTSVKYADVTHSTNAAMAETTSSVITDGGYVAIYLQRGAIDDISYTAAPVETVVTDNNGYATFASSSKLDLTTTNLPSGLTAYKAKVNGSTVKFTKLNQNVPENTGFFLEGNPYTEYKIAVASTSTDVEDANEFLVNTSGSTFDAASGYTYFAMKKNSDPLTFGTFDPSSTAIPSNKAYLKVLTESLPASRTLQFVFDDGQTTGISDASHLTDNGKMRNDNFFNLNGQRVAQPTKGLYIKNGKKVVMK